MEIKKHKSTNCPAMQLENDQKVAQWKKSWIIFLTDGGVENGPWKTGKQPAFNYHVPKRRTNVSLIQNRLMGHWQLKPFTRGSNCWNHWRTVCASCSWDPVLLWCLAWNVNVKCEMWNFYYSFYIVSLY